MPFPIWPPIVPPLAPENPVVYPSLWDTMPLQAVLLDIRWSLSCGLSAPGLTVLQLLLWWTLGVQGIPNATTSFVSIIRVTGLTFRFSDMIQIPPTKSLWALGDLDQALRGPTEASFPRLEVKEKFLTPLSRVCCCRGGRVLVLGSSALWQLSPNTFT